METEDPLDSSIVSTPTSFPPGDSQPARSSSSSQGYLHRKQETEPWKRPASELSPSRIRHRPHMRESTIPAGWTMPGDTPSGYSQCRSHSSEMPVPDSHRQPGQ